MKTTLFTLCACVALVACSKSAPTQSDAAQPDSKQASSTIAESAPSQQASTSPPPQIQQQDTAPTPALAPDPLPKDAHLYSYRENGQYGYESALSDTDQKAGLVTKPLEMYRYIGVIDGRVVIESVNGNAAMRASCEAPCEFTKTLTVSAYGQGQSNVMRLPPDSLLAAVFSDAMNGQLQPSPSPVAYLFPAAWSPSVAAATPALQPAPTPGIQPTAQAISPAQPVANEVPAAPPQPRAATTYTTSFDCSKARSDSERLICSDPELAADDVQLAEIFSRAKAAATDPDAFKQHTRSEWNYREQNCHDRDCVARWYIDQKTALEHIAETGAL